jgi:hypothetical protein
MMAAMTESEILAWLKKLSERGTSLPIDQGNNEYYRDITAATEWLAEVETALHSVFPSGHPILASWQRYLERVRVSSWPDNQPHTSRNIDQAVGIVRAAGSVVNDGHLRSVLDGVRADTVFEVLDQATVLLREKYLVAAVVLAGGALETHLRHLCERNALTGSGDGSIGKYDGAIAQARNTGTVEVYKATDGKQVTAWGGMRNYAAHDPTKFKGTNDEVGLMIAGVRDFLARTP